jgi:hypothetical protein
MRILTFIAFLFTHLCSLASVTVDSVEDLSRAITRPNTHIIVLPGIYKLNHRLQITANNVAISGATGNPNDVVFQGSGMRAPIPHSGAEVLIDVHADNFSLSGVTLEQSTNHLIQVRAETGADNFLLTNSILRDSYQQLLKVSASAKANSLFSESGTVKNCLFTYTAGIGPNFYIGGIDAHRAKHWRVENNRFENIASPSEHVAEHAIHFWRQSQNTVVKNNIIFNSDRGIGFGLSNTENEHIGGVIEGNVIIHNNKNHPYRDAGIILESARATKVIANNVLLTSGYPNAIEFRFAHTQDVEISGNTVLGEIMLRDGASGVIDNNTQLSVNAEERSVWSKLLGK